MADNKVAPRSKRGSIFFPLLLIIIGLMFLLSNMGVISGDVWILLLQFWPILLIVIGLDSIFKREGLVGATFFIGLGVIFLLANLGYLSVSVWQLVLTLWPVFLIAIGFDILIGRRSVWASIAGVILVLVILAGALWLYGVGIDSGRIPAGEKISQNLEGATQAEVLIEPGAGELQIEDQNAAGILVAGTIPAGDSQTITSSYSVNNGNGIYRLRQSSESFVVPMGKPEKWLWDLGLNRDIPIDLELRLGAGSLDADLSNLILDSLGVNIGVGSVTVLLPENGRLEAGIEGAVGQLVIIVPQGMAVRINADTGLAGIQVPPDYAKIGNSYLSPGYDSNENRVELNVAIAIGNINISQEK